MDKVRGLTTASTRPGLSARVHQRPHALVVSLVAKALSRSRRAGEAWPLGGQPVSLD